MAIYVYMLRCSDNSYYIGSATGDDLQPRIDQHNSGVFPGYTFRRRPVILVWSERFDKITDGIAAERKSKAGAAPRKKR
jgi:putative endonuclease